MESKSKTTTADIDPKALTDDMKLELYNTLALLDAFNCKPGEVSIFRQWYNELLTEITEKALLRDEQKKD